MSGEGFGVPVSVCLCNLFVFNGFSYSAYHDGCPCNHYVCAEHFCSGLHSEPKPTSLKDLGCKV